MNIVEIDGEITIVLHTKEGTIEMKKLAIISDAWKRCVNYVWVHGCEKYIKEHNLDVEVDVFHSFGNLTKDESINAGEYNIINLPDLKKYDGIVLEIINIEMEDQYNKIVDKILESGTPAVSLLIKIPGMYRCGIDNYSSMSQLVEHLITEHGCKTLNFVGGPVENTENISRRHAYMEVLEKHDIPVEPERIYEGDYEVETGMKAFGYFKDKNLLADAFVCANENIAVGLCNQAMEAGFRVPEDFKITGFDDFDKASYFEPRITTVGYSRDDIAYEAMRLLDNIWHGKEVPEIVYSKAELIFQESCGCKNNNRKRRSDYIKNKIFADVRYKDLYNESMDMNRSLIGCDTYEQMGEYLAKCLQGLKCDEMYLVMNHDIVKSQTIDDIEDIEEERITEGYPDEMDVVFACKNGDTRCDIPIEKGKLLPDIWERKTGDTRLFVPLHLREREIGYYVLVNCNYMMENQFVFEPLSSFSKALEYLYNRIVLQRTNHKLSLLYIQDALTGLYNRTAYNQLFVPLYDKCMAAKEPLAIVFFDADHLKYVNDRFGHDMGNEVITGVAEGIKQSFPSRAAAMRYGGDEFVVLVPSCTEGEVDEIVEKFHENLKKTTASKHLPFEIEASAGYVIARDASKGIDEYINDADDKMYQEKKRRKAQRSS